MSVYNSLMNDLYKQERKQRLLDEKKIKALLENETEFDKVDKKGYTPLLLALENYTPTASTMENSYIKNITSFIKALIEKGANVNIVTPKSGKPLLFYALRDYDILALLLIKAADVNTRDKEERTALMLAAGFYNSDFLEPLIFYGADVNARDNKGNTALLFAADAHSNVYEQIILKKIEILLQYGADVNAKNNDGVTPLIAAVREGSIKKMKLLLDNGADMNARKNNGDTALLLSIKSSMSNSLDAVKLLIDRGADTNAVNNEGETAIMIANKYKVLEKNKKIELLVAAGAGTKVIDMQKDSAAVLAAALPFIKSLPSRFANASKAPKYSAGHKFFDAAIEASNRKDHSGCVSNFKNAIEKGLDELREGYAYAQMGEKKLLYFSLAGEAVADFVKALSYPEVFYETAHTAAQYLRIIYENAGEADEAQRLQVLLTDANQGINYSLSFETVNKVRDIIKGVTWKRV